jgi:hypothetical protein
MVMLEGVRNSWAAMAHLSSFHNLNLSTITTLYMSFVHPDPPAVSGPKRCVQHFLPGKHSNWS